MIQGINIVLKKPDIKWEGYKLARNREVKEMLKVVDEYFEQKGTIYDATLIMTNNEYKRLPSKYGIYQKRVDYEFKLRYLDKIIIYDDYIEFVMFNNTSRDIVPVNVDKDKFFYFIEWENEYYM